MVLRIFSSACYPSICLFWRNVSLGVLPIFQLACLFFVVELYKLFVYFGDYTLVGYIVGKYFLPFFLSFWFCLFFCFFSMVFFAVKMLLDLIRFHWFIFVFIVIILGGGSNKIWFMSKSVLSTFSSRSFIASGLIFRSLIHFEYSIVTWQTTLRVYQFKTITAFILLKNLQYRQGSLVTSCLYSESAKMAQRLDAGTIWSFANLPVWLVDASYWLEPPQGYAQNTYMWLFHVAAWHSMVGGWLDA